MKIWFSPFFPIAFTAKNDDFDTSQHVHSRGFSFDELDTRAFQIHFTQTDARWFLYVSAHIFPVGIFDFFVGPLNVKWK